MVSAQTRKPTWCWCEGTCNGLVDKAAELVRRAYRGDAAAGVDSQCLDETLSRLGVGSKAAVALQTDIDLSRRQHCRDGSTKCIRKEHRGGSHRMEMQQTLCAKPPWRRANSGLGQRCN